MRKEAILYDKLKDDSLRCCLCNHRCQIPNQKFGLCGVRQNIKGVLYTYAYGELIASHVDPIEKKPLYHFIPDSYSFSIATIGCNFRCGFCQNWEISQNSFKNGFPGESQTYLPKDIVAEALVNKCKSISYTYTEPTIFFEYALDTARLAKEKGLYNNFISNGYMTKEALMIIKPYLDAANVDLKFFKEGSYKKICSAKLEPVLNTIRSMRELGIWVEVTTLVVPGENDSQEELGNIAKFLASLDNNIPWHISRFYPNYKFNNNSPTSENILKQAQSIGYESGLRYVYAGNVYGWGNDTHCHNCKELLIKRDGFSVSENNIKNSRCGYCNTVIPGVFN